MSKVNKLLIKAGLCYLIDKDKESFLDRMSMYLQDKAEFMNFLFDGPLPINDNIKKKIEEFIKATIPCNDYFKKIVKIELGFDYDYKQQYVVTYNVTRFYNQDNNPWRGLAISDNTHQIPIITEITENVTPEQLKNLNNNGKNSNFST